MKRLHTLLKPLAPIAATGIVASLIACGPQEQPAPVAPASKPPAPVQLAPVAPSLPFVVPETTTYTLAKGENPWNVTKAYLAQHLGDVSADTHWRFWNATLTGSGYASPIELDIFPFYSAENAERYKGRRRPLPQNFTPGTVLTMPNLENEQVAASYR